jgi:hypothetical protein
LSPKVLGSIPKQLKKSIKITKVPGEQKSEFYFSFRLFLPKLCKSLRNFAGWESVNEIHSFDEKKNYCVYVLKMNLFVDQLVLELSVIEGLKDLSLFYCLVYARWGIAAPDTDAAINDLNLVNQLHQLKTVNKSIANAAIDKLQNHLLYLSPEFVPLVFFSKRVTLAEKQDLQKALVTNDGVSVEERQIKKLGIPKKGRTKLKDLVNGNSVTTLEVDFDTEFLLRSNPSSWAGNEQYEKMRTKAKAIRVTNDVAKRAIAMMTKYNNELMTMQNILQVSS